MLKLDEGRGIHLVAMFTVCRELQPEGPEVLVGGVGHPGTAGSLQPGYHRLNLTKSLLNEKDNF